MCMTNWKTLLEQAMEAREETLADIVSNTLKEEEMEQMFDNGYGGTEGTPFTVWTEKTVYFPICYDGSEWVGSVSRNPNGLATTHQGGG